MAEYGQQQQYSRGRTYSTEQPHFAGDVSEDVETSGSESRCRVWENR
jgi:hypothetical protein